MEDNSSCEPVKQRKRKASRPQHLYLDTNIASMDTPISPDDNLSDRSEKLEECDDIHKENCDIEMTGNTSAHVPNIYDNNNIATANNCNTKDVPPLAICTATTKPDDYSVFEENYLRQKFMDYQNGNLIKPGGFSDYDHKINDRASVSSPKNHQGMGYINGGSLDLDGRGLPVTKPHSNNRQADHIFQNLPSTSRMSLDKPSHAPRGIDMNLSALSKFNNSLPNMSGSRLFITENGPVYKQPPGLINVSQPSSLNQNYRPDPFSQQMLRPATSLQENINNANMARPLNSQFSPLKLPTYTSSWPTNIPRDNEGPRNGRNDPLQHRPILENTDNRCQDFSSPPLDTFDEPMN